MQNYGESNDLLYCTLKLKHELLTIFAYLATSIQNIKGILLKVGMTL